MTDRDEQARTRMRELGQYLILASSEQNEVSDLLIGLAVPLPADDSRRANIEDSVKLARLAKREYIQRLRRNRYFKHDLFGEPVWDIMLDLYVSKVAGMRVSVTSACIASHVPPTTALRWIGVLEAEGYVIRTPDMTDHRRTWLELTDEAVERMGRYFRESALKMNDIKEYAVDTRSLNIGVSLNNYKNSDHD